MSESTSTTLARAIENVFKSLIADVHTSMPGIVESYDYKTQKATVKPSIKKKLKNGDVESLPVLVQVPVKFQRTAIAGMTFPINKGDKVLLIFTERSLDEWYSKGVESEPGDPRKFDLSDAIAIPGLYSFNETNIASNNSDVELHNNGQRIVLKKNGDIEIGKESLKKMVNEEFKDLFNDHGHDYASPGGPAVSGTPVSGITPVSIATPITDNELTSKVKAQ